MSQADKIREFVLREHIKPARSQSLKEVRIRAGDVHSKMGLVDRMPAVTSAIGSVIFQRKYHIRLINRDGPTNGANVIFTFLLANGNKQSRYLRLTTGSKEGGYALYDPEYTLK
jgi:hypothetical protein